MTAAADRSQLQQIVDGLAEGVILIEPDQTIAYANEAALALHGVSRLTELGVTVDDYRRTFVPKYRNHHPPGAARAPIERVVAGEAFRDVVVEVERADGTGARWVHRIRSIVTTDRTGKPDCVALVIHDETERYEAEERFHRAFSANPAPAVIVRLADLCFARVNQGFLELSGFARDDLVGRSIYEVDPLRKAQRRDLALTRLKAGETIPQMEAWLSVPADAERWVIVAGQPIEMPGQVPCMLFTFADLEARRQAEEALRHSQEHLVKAFDLSPVPTAIGEREGFKLRQVNKAFTATLGYTDAEVRGRSPAELDLWADPELQRRFEQMLKRTGSVRSFEGQLRTKAGGILDFILAAEIVTIARHQYALCTMQDITQRTHSEAELMRAIEAAMADASWFSRGVLEKLSRLRTGPGIKPVPDGLSALTAREREVLVRVSRGAGDEQIAQDLGLKRYTVRNHVAALYRKLGLRRRSDLVVYARERALAEGPSTDAPRRQKGSFEPD